ncbi:MAG: hypothetical protein RIC55_28115 [Pirellulaceae bacterium]
MLDIAGLLNAGQQFFGTVDIDSRAAATTVAFYNVASERLDEVEVPAWT